MTYKKGDRVLYEHNGVRFAGTIDDNGYVISDINGDRSIPEYIIEKLTGLRAARAGDILIGASGGERKILAISNNHEVVSLSWDNNYDGYSSSYTWSELEGNGYKLKNQPSEELSDDIRAAMELLEKEGFKVSRER